MITILKNGEVLVDGKIQQKTIIIKDGKISKIIEATSPIEVADEIIDCCGKYVFPGFIDIHIHGSGGGYSQNLNKESYELITQSQVRFGTTAILLTYIGPRDEELKEATRLIKLVNDEQNGAKIAGIHIEGPWISPKKIGYLDSNIFEFSGDAKHAQKIVNICDGYLKIVTLAPELNDIEKVIKIFTDQGIVVSCGHTEANYELAKTAICDWGVKSFTHLWNMSGPVQSREPGIVGAALFFDDCYIELVADGYHVHPVNVSNTINIKPKDKVCLVTDAMIVTGTKIDSYSFMGVNDIKVINGRTCGPNNAIIGSVLTLDKAIRNLLVWTKLPLSTVVAMATENPAKLIGVYPQKGVIRVGSDADISIFDKDMNCVCTFVEGKKQFNC